MTLASSEGANIIRDSEIQETVDLVVKPLKEAANLPNLQIHIIDDPAPNAFTAGGNDIFINSGLIIDFPDPDILLNKDRMDERQAIARDTELPEEMLMAVSKTYASIAEKITGEKIGLSENPKTEIIEILRKEYGLIT